MLYNINNTFYERVWPRGPDGEFNGGLVYGKYTCENIDNSGWSLIYTVCRYLEVNGAMWLESYDWIM